MSSEIKHQFVMNNCLIHIEHQHIGKYIKEVTACVSLFILHFCSTTEMRESVHHKTVINDGLDSTYVVDV